MAQGSNPIVDARVNGVLDRLHGQAARQFPVIAAHYVGQKIRGLFAQPKPGQDDGFYRDKMICIDRDQGWFLYLLCRAVGARRVVEFGTSHGVSTLYLAAAVRDGGGGQVIGTELDPAKAAIARANFADAGLDDLIDLREGDALETLKDCGGPVDLLLVDGWPRLGRRVIETMAPQMRRGAVAVDANVGFFPEESADYLAFVRDPANGFVSSFLRLPSGTELSVRV